MSRKFMDAVFPGKLFLNLAVHLDHLELTRAFEGNFPEHQCFFVAGNRVGRPKRNEYGSFIKKNFSSKTTWLTFKGRDSRFNPMTDSVSGFIRHAVLVMVQFAIFPGLQFRHGPCPARGRNQDSFRLKPPSWEESRPAAKPKQ